ncbi:hypothetical protein KUCAC02_031377, partial [Chaenocephalus aceratus]
QKALWMHPRSKHLIDDVIVRRSDIRDVHITRAMRGAEGWTDHRLVMAEVHMQGRPRLRLQGPRRRRLDCTRLENPNARNEASCSLAEKLGGVELSLSSSENTRDQKWTSISSALYEAAAQTIGYKNKNHPDWFDKNSETIHDLLKDMHRAHRATLKSPSSSSTRQRWQRIRREVQRATRGTQDEWWTTKAVEKIYGPTSRCITPLKTADRRPHRPGRPAYTSSYAQSGPAPNLPGGPIRSLKNNKSPGDDNIPAELLKQGGDLCTRALPKSITEVWADEIVPQQWRDANVVTIYKNKGDKAVCGNSRSISLLAVAATFTAAGEQPSVVASFRYLGSILSEDSTIDNEVQNRIKQASAAFGRLR